MEFKSDGVGSSGGAIASPRRENELAEKERVRGMSKHQLWKRLSAWLEEFLFGQGLAWMLFIPWCLQPLVMFSPKEKEPGSIWNSQFFPITEAQFYYFISALPLVYAILLINFVSASAWNEGIASFWEKRKKNERWLRAKVEVVSREDDRRKVARSEFVAFIVGVSHDATHADSHRPTPSPETPVRKDAARRKLLQQRKNKERARGYFWFSGWSYLCGCGRTVLGYIPPFAVKASYVYNFGIVILGFVVPLGLLLPLWIYTAGTIKIEFHINGFIGRILVLVLLLLQPTVFVLGKLYYLYTTYAEKVLRDIVNGDFDEINEMRAEKLAAFGGALKEGVSLTKDFLGPKQGGETNNEYRSVIERKLKNVVGVGGDDDADDEQEVSWFTKQYRRLKANFPGPLSFLEEIFDERRKSKIIVEIMIFMFIMPITGILLYFSTFADEVFAIHCSAETGKQLYLVLMVAPPLLLIPYYGLTLCLVEREIPPRVNSILVLEKLKFHQWQLDSSLCAKKRELLRQGGIGRMKKGEAPHETGWERHRMYTYPRWSIGSGLITTGERREILRLVDRTKVVDLFRFAITAVLFFLLPICMTAVYFEAGELLDGLDQAPSFPSSGAVSQALAQALEEAVTNFTNAINITNATTTINITLSPSPAPSRTAFILSPKFPAGTTRTIFLLYCVGYPTLFILFFAFKFVFQIIPVHLKQWKLFFVMLRWTGILVFIPSLLLWFYSIRSSHFGEMGRNTIFAIVGSFPTSFFLVVFSYIVSNLYYFFAWIRTWRIEEGLTVGMAKVALYMAQVTGLFPVLFSILSLFLLLYWEQKPLGLTVVYVICVTVISWLNSILVFVANLSAIYLGIVDSTTNTVSFANIVSTMMPMGIGVWGSTFLDRWVRQKSWTAQGDAETLSFTRYTLLSTACQTAAMFVLYRRLNRAQRLFARFGYHPQEWEVFDPNTLADSSIASYKQSTETIDENIKYLRSQMLDEKEVARKYNVRNCFVQADEDWAKTFFEGVYRRYAQRWEQWRGGRKYNQN